jgi:hypothetical protein
MAVFVTTSTAAMVPARLIFARQILMINVSMLPVIRQLKVRDFNGVSSRPSGFNKGETFCGGPLCGEYLGQCAAGLCELSAPSLKVPAASAKTRTTRARTFRMVVLFDFERPPCQPRPP